MTHNIVIAGYYGYRNAGDEAILAGMLADLRLEIPDATFTVFSGDPDDTRRLHRVEAVAWSDLPTQVEAVKAASLVIVGGGGLFQDYWGVDAASLLTSRSAGIALYAGPIVLARMMGKPSMLYAVGVGPLLSDEARRLTREAVGLADVVIVRDAASMQLLEDIGCVRGSITVTADPAFGLDMKPLSRAAQARLDALPRPIVGVSVRAWSIGVDPETWQAAVAGGLDEFLAAEGGTALFVPMQTGTNGLGDDVTASQSVIARMGRRHHAHLWPTADGPLERFDVFTYCDLVLGMRLHSAVAAIRARVPCVGLEYDEKVGNFLRQQGRSPSLMKLSGIHSGQVVEALRAALKSRLPEAVAPLLIEDDSRSSPREAAAAARRLAGEGTASGSSRQRLDGLLLERILATYGLLEELDEARLGEAEAAQAANSERDRNANLASELDALQERNEALQQGVRLSEGQAQHVEAEKQRLQAESDRLKATRGWRLLSSAWRAVWTIRGALDPFRPLIGGIRLQFSIAKAWLRSARRFLTPLLIRRLAFVSGPGAYMREFNSETILYSDDRSLFVGYNPRRALHLSPVKREKVSLVVTVRNEARTARSWVHDISKQTRPPDEIIILDGGSTDHTPEILLASGTETDSPLKLIRLPSLSIGMRRNAGVRAASNRLIAMTDLGCSVAPDWLVNLVSPLETDGAVEMSAGWYHPVASSHLWRRAANELVPRIDSVDPLSFLPATRSIAFTKEAWRRAGGFPEWLTYAGEDTYFALEMARTCRARAFFPEAKVGWHAPESLAGVWRKLVSWSAGDGESGVYSRRYWRRVKILAAADGILLAGIAAGLISSASNATSGWIAAAAGILLAGLVGLKLVAHRGWHPIDLAWGVLGQHARAVGYVRGALNRPRVAAKKHADVKGVRFVLSGVPMDDSGGGQRGAQMAREWLELGFLVVFLYKFPRAESIDLKLSIRHPKLLHWSLDEFDWEAFQWEYGSILNEKTVAALVEFPHADFDPIVRKIRLVGGRVAYDLIDDWRTVLGGSWYSTRVERELAMLCDVLLATAPSLAKYLEDLTGRPVHSLPNAADERTFDPGRSHPRPPDLPVHGPTILYSGSLWGPWFDWALLMRVAESLPESNIVVIGDYRGQAPLSPPNVHFLGLKPQSVLPNYISHSAVAILPWRLDAVTAATDPLKVYEYLFLGVPVVVPRLGALPSSELILQASSDEDFVSKIRFALELSSASARDDHGFRRDNCWSARLRELEPLLDPAASGLLAKGRSGQRMISSDPLVSVVIPCFNHGEFVLEAIESVRAQTVDSVQILVVDDGSTDPRTLDVLANLPASQVMTVRRRRQGLPAARNYGIAATASKYVCCLDADDTIEPTYLEKSALAMEAYPGVGMVYSQARVFGSEERVWRAREFEFLGLLSGNYIVAAAVYRRTCWDQVGGYWTAMSPGYEDWELWIRIAAAGYRGHLIPELLFNRRKHGPSMIDQAKAHHNELLDKIKTRHSTLFEGTLGVDRIVNGFDYSFAVPSFDNAIPSIKAVGRSVQGILVLLCDDEASLSSDAELIKREVGIEGDNDVYVVRAAWDPARREGLFERLRAMEHVCSPTQGRPVFLYDLRNFLPRQAFERFICHLVVVRNIRSVRVFERQPAPWGGGMIAQRFPWMEIIDLAPSDRTS